MSRTFANVRLRFVGMPIADVGQSFWLSNGIVRASSLSKLSGEYAEDSYVPAPTWRRPSGVDVQESCQPDLPSHAAFEISVFPLDTEQCPQLVELVGSLKTLASVPEIYQHPLCSPALNEIVSFVSPLLTDEKSLVVHGFMKYPSGLPTVTFDESNRRFIGLHVDSWDGLPIEKRRDATTRICINLSNEARYFLFLAITLDEMRLQLFRNGYLSQWFPDCNQLIRHYMSRFPQHDVIKVEIPPWHAYLAPTENIVHDATTEGRSTCDLNFTVRGHFRSP